MKNCKNPHAILAIAVYCLFSSLALSANQIALAKSELLSVTTWNCVSRRLDIQPNGIRPNVNGSTAGFMSGLNDMINAAPQGLKIVLAQNNGMISFFMRESYHYVHVEGFELRKGNPFPIIPNEWNRKTKGVRLIMNAKNQNNASYDFWLVRTGRKSFSGMWRNTHDEWGTCYLNEDMSVPQSEAQKRASQIRENHIIDSFNF